MKVLVTGGAGYIGSATTALLLDRGYDVAVFDNLERGHRAALDPRARFHPGDLRNASRIADVLAAETPEAVVHFAAYALVGESMANPGLYFRNNIAGGINLLDAMVAAQTSRIVFSSTCATYGTPESLPLRESDPTHPTNPYGASKRSFESILDWYHTIHGIHPVCLRYFNACGATDRLGEDHTPETHLIPNVLRVALGQAPAVAILGDDYPTPDGTCIRDYIHISDLAAAHALALETPHHGVFNLGVGQGCSVREIIDAARRVTSHPIPCTISPRRPGDPPALVACADKAASDLGWQPAFTRIDDIIASAWAWHQRHPHGYTVAQ